MFSLFAGAAVLAEAPRPTLWPALKTLILWLQEELGISEDEFEDLQSLFQLFDHDKVGQDCGADDF